MHRFRTLAPRNTTAAGYGAAHQRERKRRLRHTTAADRCGYCQCPLGPERLPGDKQSRWALPHNDTRTGYLPGMWHKFCNDSDGGKRSRRQPRLARAQSRVW